MILLRTKYALVLKQTDENEREPRTPRSSRRLYFNEGSLRPSLKLSSFQRQYHDHIDSKVIPDSFRLAAFIKFTSSPSDSHSYSQYLNWIFFHSLARRYIGISANLFQFSPPRSLVN